MSFHALTSEALDAFYDHVETDTIFRAWCLENLGFYIERGDEPSLQKDSTKRLEHLFEFPEDWDSRKFNAPVHVYTTIPGQITEQEHAFFTPKNTTLRIAVRFHNTVDVTLIYDFVDYFQRCIRHFDAIAIPLWENQDTEFFFTEKSFPVVMLTVGITHEIGDCE